MVDGMHVRTNLPRTRLVRRTPRALAFASLPLLSVLLTAIPWADAAAQPPTGTLRVEVRSEGLAVVGVDVRAGNVLATTDADGVARLALPAGEHRVEVRGIGYERETVPVRIEAGSETSVVVELEIDAHDEEEIIVTSTRTGRRVQDEVLRVEVLDREEIEEKMLMTPGNIAMLLNETGGLRVQVTSPSLGATNIRVQGMRGHYTLLLADGLPLYGGQAGSIGLLQIPPTDLGQVEVIKGAASALHGASALGGVINLISRRPAEEASLELLGNTTSHDGQDLTAWLSGPISDDWSYSVLGGVHRQSARDLDGSGWVSVPAHRRATIRPRLHRSGDGGRAIFVTVGGMTERREGGTLPGETLPSGAAFPETLDTERVDAGLTVRHPIEGLGFLLLRASAMTQRHDHLFGASTDRDRHTTSFAEGALTGASGAHTWVVGAALLADRYGSPTFPAFDYAFTVPALFAQNDVRVSSDLSLSASLRWDHHGEYDSHLSPRLSALFRPDPWTMRISVATGFFAPTPFVEAIDATGLRFLEPLQGLRAERARTASIDVGRAFDSFEMNAVLFASSIRDAVRLVDGNEGTPPAEPSVRLVNIPGETRTVGTELLLRYRWDDFSITGSHVFVRASEPDPVANGRRDVPLTPTHTAGLVAMWEDHDRGLLGVEAYYTGRQPLDDNPYRGEGLPHVHIGVLGEIRWESVSLFLNAENLLDVRQTRHDPLLREERGRDGRWTVDAWAPLDGFVVNGGMRVRLGG